ncbi:glycosyltransferase family 2 protein [Cryobacterium roopkundense]|uniref:GT2 family glycosyltransferase n=1 Tax=Cryobacterium roopkundense TaxID=1001240 RepID=A0A7W8ZYQ0_9MICO|nr:glycosyltransferase family 2 protein [Cryobacterium roopkundense]MBB5642395.1 GT2 family glycosyltransferase [Cryobacterium roopkundense]
MKLHVIMACHNRRDLTVGAVRSAVLAAKAAHVAVDFTIYDDGSTDGTAEALANLGAHITVLSGDGSAFWARSMARAEADVLARVGADARPDDRIVWLNDDVILDETAFQAVDATGPDAVSVGAMRDATSGEITYGGLVKTGWHPLRFDGVNPGAQPLPIDSFNGNLVFVPVHVAVRLGGIDGEYSHALADIDYGLRCGRGNIPVLLLPSSLGVCARNPPEPNDGVRRQWRRFVGVKGGGHLSSLTRMVKKGAPRQWPLYVSATYIFWWVRHLSAPLQQRRSAVHSGR